MMSAEHEAMAVERPIGSSNDDGQSCDGRWAEGGFGVLPGASPPAADAVRGVAEGGLRGARPRTASIANSQTHAATIPSLLSDHPRTQFGCAGVERGTGKCGASVRRGRRLG